MPQKHRALRRVRETTGLTNVRVVIPFCRTVDEADRVLGVLPDWDLQCGRDGLDVTMTTKTSSNVVLVGEFAERFDGFSIGTNGLAQVMLGIDRD